jgi:hypothetical protein
MKYYNYLSGGMTPAHFFAALTIAAIGWGSFKALSFLARDRDSQRTPVRASIKLWLRVNWREAAAHVVLMFTLVRFASEIVVRYMPEGVDFINSDDPMWIYFGVGFAKSFIIEKMWKGKKR